MSALKIVAASVTLLGLILGFLERRYAPKTIVTEDSPNYPEWLAWLGWTLAGVGALAYVAIDLLAK
jgi:hypothetical protein